MTTFADLNLCPELNATLETLGYSEPTPIQREAIPRVLSGQDLIAQAQTGTGKTASFALPMIERLSRQPCTADYHAIRGLILVPTRELAIQVGDNTLAYGRLLGMRVISIFGGVRFDNQVRKLKRGADILVATPGRLLDMLQQKKISLAGLEMLVFDEADRMLDLGFINEIKALLAFMPADKQTLLFSATLDDSVEALAEALLDTPQRVCVTPRQLASTQVRQRAYAVERGDKTDVLIYLIQGANWQQTLVFTRTKRGADALCAALLDEGISAGAIHGDKHQRERIAALEAFSSGNLKVLVATDVAARGLDIDHLPQVVNYDLPQQPQDYVHRIGRTGRAGQKGLAVSLVAPDETRFLESISALIGKALQLQPVPVAEGGRLIDGKALPNRGAVAKPRRQTKAKPVRGSKKTGSPPARAVAEEKPPARSAGRRSLFAK